MDTSVDGPLFLPTGDGDALVEPSLVRLLGETSDLAVVTAEPGGQVIHWNQGAERLLGYRAEDIIGRALSTLCPDHTGDHERCVVDAAMQSPGDTDGWLRCRDGSTLWATLVCVALHDQRGELQGFGIIVRNASERRRVETALSENAARLEELAATDSLTGLRNRRDFDRLLRTLPRERFALLAIDIDGLKLMNDEFGHAAGDVLIRSVATTDEHQAVPSVCDETSHQVSWSDFKLGCNIVL